MNTQENKELVALLKKHAIKFKQAGGHKASVGCQMEELAVELEKIGEKHEPIKFAKAVPITVKPYQPIGGG
jgi:hypothetical protein